MEISRRTVAVNDYKEIKAKQDEFHAIEDLFDLYWELQTNLRPLSNGLRARTLNYMPIFGMFTAFDRERRGGLQPHV